MKPPGFLRACWIIGVKDLRLEWRTWETLSTSVIFSLIVLLVFTFTFGLDASPAEARSVAPGAIWTVLAFAAVVGLSRSAQLERQHDAISALLLAPVDRGALYLGKALANSVKLALLAALVLILAAVLFHYDLLALAGPLVGVVALHAVGLTELGTLFAAVTSRIGRGEALLATLLFPAATPLFISAVRCTAAVLEHKPLSSVSHWMLIAMGFDLLYLFVGLLAFEFVLEE